MKPAKCSRVPSLPHVILSFESEVYVQAFIDYIASLQLMVS